MKGTALMLALAFLAASFGIAEAQKTDQPVNGQMPTDTSMGGQMQDMPMGGPMRGQCGQMHGAMPMDGRMSMSYGFCGLEDCFLIGPMFGFLGHALFLLFHSTGMVCMRLAMRFVK
jgi:hypothetical protein